MITPALAAVLRPADILLIGRTGLVSDVIRRVTHSQYSHLGLVARSSGAWIVIEASVRVNGVAARKIEMLLDDPTVEHRLLLRAPRAAGFEAPIVQAMWLETGEPYSQRVNLEILLGEPVEETDGVNCAAAVNIAYQKGAGFGLIDPAVPTPERIFLSPELVAVWP